MYVYIYIYVSVQPSKAYRVCINIYICTEMAPSLEWKGQKQKSEHNGVPISRGKNKYRLRRCESIRTPYRMHLNEAAGGFAGGLYEACTVMAIYQL